MLRRLFGFLKSDKNYLNITWKDVLNEHAPYRKWVGNIENYLSIVDLAGYEYFSWNDRVYRFTGYGNAHKYYDTNLTIEDLE